MARVLQPCGTPAGYKRHTGRGESTCRPCREAYAESMAVRRRDPAYLAAEKRQKAARSRAMVRLTKEFSVRFAAIMREEMRAVLGVDSGPA